MTKQELHVIKVSVKNSNIQVIGKYVNQEKPILYKCNICKHEWEESPKSLLRKCVCPVCAQNEKNEEYLFKLCNKYPNIEFLGKYNGCNAEIECRCRICGYKWNATPHSLQNRGCKKCGIQRRAKKRRKSVGKFIEEMQQINPNLTICGEYINSCTPIQCICNICGHSWPASPGHLLDGHGCPECAKQVKGYKLRMNNDEFIQRLKDIDSSMIPLEKYITIRKAIKCQCSLCGDIDLKKPINLLQGHGCTKCGLEKNAAKRRLPQTVFKERLKEIQPNLQVLGPYKSRNKAVSVKCKICGHTWKPSANNLLSGYGCPKCNKYSSSFPEQFIYNSFVFLLGEKEVFSRDTKTIGRELDIYIPSLSLAIEYGTWYWHYDKLDKDEDKIKMCAEKGIKCITILDNCPQGYFNAAFWCFYHKLERDPDVLSCIVYDLLKLVQLGDRFHEIPFDNIIETSKDLLIRKINHKAVRVQNVETKEVFNSLFEAAKSVGLKTEVGISRCCKGLQTISGGYHWRYVEENNNDGTDENTSDDNKEMGE